jgi:hypothetical protein
MRANGCEYSGQGLEMVGRFELGRLDMLQWLRADDCPWGRSVGLLRGAFCGQLAAMVWAHAEGCPWHPRTCYAAAKYGHLDVLQWAHANGCPWDHHTYKAAADRYASVGDDSSRDSARSMAALRHRWNRNGRSRAHASSPRLHAFEATHSRSGLAPSEFTKRAVPEHAEP